MARLSIHEFERFVTDAQAHVAELYREIEEVQQALNDARERTRLERQDLVERARQVLRTARFELDGSFVADWDARVDQESASLETEATVLDELIGAEQAKADEKLARVAEIRAGLRSTNPELDAREEALKADLARLDQESDDLDAEIARMAKWFGLLFRKCAIQERGKKLLALDKRLAAVARALDSVRSEWVTVLQTATEEELAIQTEWQAAQLRVARMRQDLAKIRDDAGGEAERRALFSMVQGAAEPPPTGHSELDALLAEIDRLSDDVLDEQEKALQAGAEMLGMLSGIGQGLDGFRESVRSVRAEQDAHSELPKLVLDIPDPVISFHGYWTQLSQYIVNERQMAAHPASFVQAIRGVIDRQLSGDAIERMFTEMGDALSTGTERWNA